MWPGGASLLAAATCTAAQVMDTCELCQSAHLSFLVLELGTALHRGFGHAGPQARMTHWRRVPGSSPHMRLLRGQGPALHLWVCRLLWRLLQASYDAKKLLGS